MRLLPPRSDYAERIKSVVSHHKGLDAAAVSARNSTAPRMNVMAIPFAEHVSSAQRQELSDLLAANPTESTLFHALGAAMGAEAFGDDPEDGGRAVFRRRAQEIRDAVCGNALVRNYCTNPNVSDTTSIAVSITGALVSAHFSGINVVLVAALVTRIGLRSICGDAVRPTPKTALDE